MHYAKIAGTGGYVPSQLLTNDDLARRVDTSDEWIMRRVGVKSRHVIGDSDETVASMCLKAATEALANAGLAPDALDLILVATASADHFFPSNACVLQHQIGVTRSIPAFDLNAACAGFIYALSVADQYIKSGSCQHVLVVGVDRLSQLVDWSDRSTCILFGDGAGAVVLSSQLQPGILSTDIQADGGHHGLLHCANGISNPHESTTIKMQGNEVFKVAVTRLGEIVEQTLAKHNIPQSELDWLIPHQANQRIIAATARKLGLPLERVILTLETHGNTSAASVPLALHDGVQQGKIQRGQLLLLEAFGAGLAWGSALVRY